jgi:hypothetical protein
VDAWHYCQNQCLICCDLTAMSARVERHIQARI